MSEKYPITSEMLHAWLKSSVLLGMGYIKVSNYGDCSALVEKGIYTVTKNGHTVVRRTSRQRQYKIFKELIVKYLNFERNGFLYYWHNGSWRRTKQNTVRNSKNL